jgi:hypothetical protein
MMLRGHCWGVTCYMTTERGDRLQGIDSVESMVLKSLKIQALVELS